MWGGRPLKAPYPSLYEPVREGVRVYSYTETVLQASSSHRQMLLRTASYPHSGMFGELNASISASKNSLRKAEKTVDIQYRYDTIAMGRLQNI